MSKLTKPYFKACFGKGLSARSKAQYRKIVKPTTAPNALAIPAEIT